MDLTEAKQANANRHFWELARADAILKEAGNLPGTACLDYGAGDLYFADQLSRSTGRKVLAFDPMASYFIDDSRLLATNQVKSVEQHGPFDRIFLLDVLEHVENEAEILRNISSLLKADGRLLVTVPAYQFLFSEHDVFLKHYRRYNRAQLLKALEANGFIIEKSWYFYHSLFLIRTLQKGITLFKREKPQEGVGTWPYPENHIVTRTLRRILTIDFAACKLLSKLGLRIPGLSVFASCKKISA